MRRRRGNPHTEHIRFDPGKCKACWHCIEVCPENVFGRINIIIHKHAKIINAPRCTGCRKCVKVCKTGAIEPLEKSRSTCDDTEAL